MDIFRSFSEKITFQNQAGQYHGREFAISRTMKLPDDSLPALIRLEEIRLDLELRKQVLSNFILEGVITGEQMQARLQPYKDLLAKAEIAFEDAIAPKDQFRSPF